MVWLVWDMWTTPVNTVMIFPVLQKARNFLPPDILKPQGLFHAVNWSQNSVVGKTKPWAWSGIRIPVGVGYVYLFQNVQTASVGQHSLLFNGHSDSFYSGNNTFTLRVTVTCFSHPLKGIQIIHSTLCSISLTWMQMNYVRSSRKMTYFIVVH